MSRYSIRPLANDDLDLILAWRNHPNIRAVMLSNHEISQQEHKLWFENTKNNNDRELMICEEEGTPFGFVQFSGMQNGAGEVDWGFYLSPQARPRSGNGLGILALEYIFERHKKNEVKSQVFEHNKSSIKFHERLGFKRKPFHVSGMSNDKKYPLIYFGLKKDEFIKLRNSGVVSVL